MIDMAVVLVTGAYSGLGLQISNEFAEKGNTVVLAGRDEKKLNELAENLRKSNLECFPLKADLRKREECEALIKNTVQKYGKLDILINNAGVWSSQNGPDAIADIIDTNVKALEYTSTYAIKQMELQGFGTIVNVASTAGVRFKPNEAVYASSKFAVIGYTGNLALMHGNKLNIICFAPGGIKTNLFRNDTSRLEESFMDAHKVAKVLYGIIQDGKNGLFVLERTGKLWHSIFAQNMPIWNKDFETDKDVK